MRMKRWRAFVLATVLTGICPVQAINDAAVNDVLKLQSSGLAEETIVAYIKSKNLNYDLTADDAIALRQKGITTPVLNAMLASGKGAVAPAPVRPPVPVAPPPPMAAPPPPAVMPAAPALPVGATGLALVTPSPALNPDISYFYQELSPYGRWIIAEDKVWYWQPTEVYITSGWRPYWNKGHWVNTDAGWYWESDYPWGATVFHYGRWRLHPTLGWIWFPGRTWAPAWVAWRSGGDYCGWAPLPPGSHFDANAGRFMFQGKAVDASFEFGLDYHVYNFCLLREMGDSYVGHWRKDDEIRVMYGRTVVANRYAAHQVVIGKQTEVRVANHGIDPERVSKAKGKSLPPVHIREFSAPPGDRPGDRLDNRNQTLEIYRPKWDERGRH